jgi:hypothetical protein
MAERSLLLLELAWRLRTESRLLESCRRGEETDVVEWRWEWA